MSESNHVKYSIPREKIEVNDQSSKYPQTARSRWRFKKKTHEWVKILTKTQKLAGLKLM